MANQNRYERGERNEMVVNGDGVHLDLARLTGAASQSKFTILSYGENYTHLSPTELSADYTFSSLQRFGEQFLTEYVDAHRLPINILQKVIINSGGVRRQST